MSLSAATDKSSHTTCTFFEVLDGGASITLDGALARLFGAGETHTLPMAEFVAAFAPDQRERAARAFAPSFGARVRREELCMIGSDGASQPIVVELRQSADERGRPRICGALLDQRGSARAAQELAAARARLAQLSAGLPNAIVSFHSEDMTFLEVYGDELARLNLTPNDLLGRPPEEIYSPDSLALIRMKSQEALASGRPVTFENSFGAVTYLVNMMPVDAGDGTRQLLVLSTNITELRAAREALREAKEATERASEARLAFLAGIAHEVRTPLAGIVGLLDLVEGDDDESARRRHLGRLRGLSAFLERMVEDLLDLAYIEADRLRLESARFDVAEVLAPVAERLLPALDRGISATLDLPNSGTSFVGDALRIHQILDNLVSNAVKYTVEGEIAARVSVDGDRLVLEVSDTGEGIEPAELSRIFDSFVRVDGDVRRVAGFGLGLAVVRRLVEQMGGEIRVASERWRGSTFTATIPSARLDPRPAAGEEPGGEVLAGASALLVEDNEVNRLVLSELLRREAMDVLAVEDAEHAERALAAKRFDIALVDVGLPDRSGLTVIEALRRRELAEGRSPDVVVALTANTGEEHVRRCLAAGADAHVAKPVAQSPLRRTLAELLTRARARGPAPRGG